MTSPIKKHPFSTLIAVTALLTSIELVLHILYGYGVNIFFLFFPLFFAAGMRYVAILICIAVSIWSIIRHQHRIFFTLSWIFLAAFGQIPKEHYEALGAVLPIFSANPEQVLNDARMLANEYPPMTCFGFPARIPCNEPVAYDQIPSSIRNVHPGHVLVLDDYVLIAQFGLEGVFRGFVAFQEGADIWEHEPWITRSGCSICWKIRVIDGLYWYHADPSAPPIFISPLH